MSTCVVMSVRISLHSCCEVLAVSSVITKQSIMIAGYHSKDAYRCIRAGLVQKVLVTCSTYNAIQINSNVSVISFNSFLSFELSLAPTSIHPGKRHITRHFLLVVLLPDTIFIWTIGPFFSQSLGLKSALCAIPTCQNEWCISSSDVNMRCDVLRKSACSFVVMRQPYQA